MKDYPQALYLDGEYRAVQDAEEEALWRERGWAHYIIDKARREGVELSDDELAAHGLTAADRQIIKRKPGRPRKDAT